MLSKKIKNIQFIIHRINKINELKKIDKAFGIEIDIRAKDSRLILNHEPYMNGDNLEDYLENYNNNTLILNIKESGIENDVLSIVKKFNIKSYFLLDIEFPFIFNLIKNENKNFAIRFSEYENINTLKDYNGIADWAWIDTPNINPINKSNIKILKNFKSCLVCPERWGRIQDIQNYKIIFENLKYYPYAIMTAKDTLKLWLND